MRWRERLPEADLAIAPFPPGEDQDIVLELELDATRKREPSRYPGSVFDILTNLGVLRILDRGSLARI